MKKVIYLSLILSASIIYSCATGGSSGKGITEATTDGQKEGSDVDSSSAQGEMSRKKELITSLVGDYNLTYIEGLMGANTMVEYTLHDAEWNASGSSIENGMREAYPVELTNEDQKQINSLQITVSEDLTVSFSTNGKEYFSVPFSEDGMSYSLANPVSEYYSVIPEDLTAATTFIKSELYLIAQDEFGKGQLEGADILEVDADAVMLTYNETTKSFELSIFYADCCDTGIYTFK